MSEYSGVKIFTFPNLVCFFKESSAGQIKGHSGPDVARGPYFRDPCSKLFGHCSIIIYSSMQLRFKQEILSSIQLPFEQELYSSVKHLFKQEFVFINQLLFKRELFLSNPTAI